MKSSQGCREPFVPVIDTVDREVLETFGMRNVIEEADDVLGEARLLLERYASDVREEIEEIRDGGILVKEACEMDARNRGIGREGWSFLRKTRWVEVDATFAR